MQVHQDSYWESMYVKETAKLPNYDGWLDEYIPNLKQCTAIIDLGCGLGVNALHLYQHGITLTACDFSKSALEKLASKIPCISTYCFDMTEGLPFLPSSIDAVIADLSLHYFSSSVTKMVLADIDRILCPSGLLLLRVNAYEDGFDSEAYEVIEDDYYIVNGCTKRFFTPFTLQAYFQSWNIIKMEQQITQKYGFTKPVIFAEVSKKGM